MSKPVCGEVHPTNPRITCRRDGEHRDEDYSGRHGYMRRWHRGMSPDGVVLAWQPARNWELSHPPLRLVK